MLFILNHKSNLTYDEIKKYEKSIRNMNVIVMPSTCYLSMFKKGKYVLGSQDISEFSNNSRTGEVNGEQLKSINVKYCLIGHSERRIYNKETQNILNAKINNCLNNNIVPIYCISCENTKNIKDELIKEISLIIKEYSNKEIIFAYEPLENIGSLNPNLINVDEILSSIKKYIMDKYNKKIKLIYGGGINVNNIEKIKRIQSIDGILLSTNSLNKEQLKKIYKTINTK